MSLAPSDIKSADAAFQKMQEADQLLSIFKDDSEVSRLNRDGGGRLSPELSALLTRALSLSESTQGAFDVTIGALTLDAYGFATDHEKVPSDIETRATAKRGGYRNLRIHNQELNLPRGMKLDFGGIGKGYAVDRAASELHKREVEAGIVSASGDIRCLGPCLSGIAHPMDRERMLATFRTRFNNISLSTSGTSERKIKGTQTHHLLNPSTGTPANYFASVTLVGTVDNTLLDGLTTAVFVSGPTAIKLLERYPEVGFVLVTPEGEVIYNQRFAELVTDLVWLAQADFRIRQQVIKKAL